MNYFSKIKQAIELKIYQYELTLGLYMLEGWEKMTFSRTLFHHLNQVDTILLTFICFLIYAMLYIVPGQMTYFLKQASYYLTQDDINQKEL